MPSLCTRPRVVPLSALLLASLSAGPVASQGAVGDLEGHITQGIEDASQRDPEGAARHFEAALGIDSSSYEANWRLAEALMDIGKQTPDDVKSKPRDSLYALAEVYARRAVDIALLEPDGHYALAAAIGRASLTKSNRERVARAREIRVEALKALELDPEHDKAHHAIGLWHAEIKRLSGVQRWFAKNLFGGDFLDLASWDLAVEHLELSVAIDPAVIYHHLDLGRVYLDTDRPADAKDQFEAVDSLPVFDVVDPRYKEEAAVLLLEILEEEGRD